MTNAIFLSLLFRPAVTHAQRVTNVTAEQQGQVLEISYALEADGPANVDLFFSTDQGKCWQGPLSNCSGDVGKNVLAGASKRIRWAVLQDRELVGDGIRLKVVAKGAMVKAWLNPKLSYGSVTDIDGNTYAAIQIGKQVWMAENLRTSRYRDGGPIPNVTDGNARAQLTTGAWAHFDNDKQHEQPYGKLYNWHTVANPRKLCPVDWHVPNDAEWGVLKERLGESAGGKTKATLLWHVPNIGATNESGFTALPGGNRGLNDNGFNFLGDNIDWWSASESGADVA